MLTDRVSLFLFASFRNFLYVLQFISVFNSLYFLQALFLLLMCLLVAFVSHGFLDFFSFLMPNSGIFRSTCSMHHWQYRFRLLFPSRDFPDLR